MEGVIKNVAICAPFIMSRDTNCTAIEPKITRIAQWELAFNFHSMLNQYGENI
jgi:hypothetical protein